MSGFGERLHVASHDLRHAGEQQKKGPRRESGAGPFSVVASRCSS
jgi:hypothetical protein